MTKCLCLLTRTLLLTFLLAGLTSALAVGQERPAGVVMPQEFSEKEILQNIGRLRSSMYNPSSLVGILELQFDVLKSEIEMHRQLEELVRLNFGQLRAESEKIDSIIRETIDTAEKDNGVLVDRETTNLLMRNCLVELQRLDWELAAERALPEPKAENTDLAAARMEVDAQQAELDRIAARLKSAEKPGQDVLIEQQASLRIAEAKLNEARMRLESIAGSGSQAAAGRVLQMTEKRKVLAEQLEKLKQQRNTWRHVEQMQTESALLKERFSVVLQDLSKIQYEQTRRTVTSEAVDAALKAVAEPEAVESKPETEQ